MVLWRSCCLTLTYHSLSTPGQPQVRTAQQGLQPSTPKDCTPLLQNGAGHVPDPGGANGEAGNGVLRSLPSSQKPHRKLQSHHSINSQSSKKSKGSSKSASSQIPIEAQEGTCCPCVPPSLVPQTLLTLMGMKAPRIRGRGERDCGL